MGDDLTRDLQTYGCPVCDHLENAIFVYFSRLQYDLYHEEKIRNAFADEGGLCRFHIWQLAAFSSARGLAKGLPPLLSHIAKELLRMAECENEGGAEQKIPGERDADCFVCALLHQEEETYMVRLIEFLNREEGLPLYENSQGVCIRHLGLLVKSVPRETERFLLRHAAGRLQEMETHLKSYDRKLESGNRHDCSPKEKNADRCGLIHIAGAKYLSFPLK